MTKRMCDTDIWKKDWYLELSLKQKLLVKFLFDNCDCAGIYEISYRTLKNCFNEEITKEDFIGIKQIKFLDDSTIYLEDFIKFQYGVEVNELKPNYRVHIGVIKRLEKYNLIQRVSKGFANPLLRVHSTVQDKEKDKNIEKDSNLSFLDSSFLSEEQKLYGEYNNVCLSKEQYNKLLGICASEKLLNELMNSFSVNIEVGKERPYIADLPNAHYERLKSYYNYRRKYPYKFNENITNPQSRSHIFKELEEQARKEGKI